MAHETEAPSDGRGMSPSQQRVVIYLLVGLLVLYAAPLILGAGAYLIGQLNGGSGPGKVLLILITSDGPYGQASALMTPLIAGLTVATLWSRAYRRWVYVCIGLSVVGILAAVILWYGLGDEKTAQSLTYYGVETAAEVTAAFAILKDKFLGGAIGSLATVIGVLLGLRATEAKE